VCLVKEDRNKLEPKSHEGFQVRYDHVSWLWLVKVFFIRLWCLFFTINMMCP
jgi:hypothetical protein